MLSSSRCRAREGIRGSRPGALAPDQLAQVALPLASSGRRYADWLTGGRSCSAMRLVESFMVSQATGGRCRGIASLASRASRPRYALANGSFNALRKYSCSHPARPLLALWVREGECDATAVGLHRARAVSARFRRIGDIPSRLASMTFNSSRPARTSCAAPAVETMVQSEWYHPVREQSWAE